MRRSSVRLRQAAQDHRTPEADFSDVPVLSVCDAALRATRPRGTFLLEDPEEPTLVFPVDANSAMAAVRFVEGVAKLGELDVVRGCVYEAPVGEFEVDQSEEV